MANIVISRIQHRRGRRENLPQPLLPGEVGVTSDTSQAWMGLDPDLAVPSINVYTNKTQNTAQSIIDNNIVEVRYGQGFSAANFSTLQGALIADGSVTLTENDILWDSNRRGTIVSITVTNAGTNYVDGTSITAVSSTGSGFVGVINCSTSPGPITSITITNGGQNYQTGNTTLSVSGGDSNAVLTLNATDLWDSTVHIAGDTNIDANNTVANIKTAVTNVTAVSSLLSSTDTAGGWAYGNDTGGVDRTFAAESLIVNNHDEAVNVTTLINRVNSTTPGENTGLVTTNLNLEITPPPTVTSLQVAGSDLVTTITTGTTVAYFRAPSDILLTEVRASLLTASTSGAVTVDINVDGSSILSTLLTIDQDEKTSVTAATPAVIDPSSSTIANDAEVTIDIDGAGTGALGLIVTFIGVS